MHFLKKVKTSFIVLFMLLLIGFNQAYAITTSQLENYRVKIHTTTSSTTIRVNNGYDIKIDGIDSLYALSSSGENITFVKNNGRILLKNASGITIGEGNEIKLLKKDNSTRYFEVKGIDGVEYSKYPDNAIVRLDSSKSNVLVINVTPLETYIKGVIPYEMGASAPLEAMKAQAITARTLAVKRVNKYNADGYDITNTTSDQVYKGYNTTYFTPTHNVSKAVDQTKGVVLAYNGRLIEGIFYSNNGGQTISDGFVWGYGNATPYYTAKKDMYDTYLHKTALSWGKISYNFTYTKDALRDIIINNSKKYPSYYKTPYCTPNFNGLSENYTIEVLNQIDGYVTQIRLSDDTGRSYIIKNYANRWVFGLRSQQYTLTQKGGLFAKSNNKTSQKETVYIKSTNNSMTEVDKSSVYIKSSTATKNTEDIKYSFDGKGYGHGIGMSQNGAMNRAENGQNYKQILEFYYTGCKTIDNYGD